MCSVTQKYCIKSGYNCSCIVGGYIVLKKTIHSLISLYKIIIEMDRVMVLLMLIHSILNAIIPFGAIIISGRVIDMMTEGIQYKHIILFAALGCICMLVIYLTQNIFHKICETRKNLCIRKYDTLIAKHTVNMKYEYLEGEEVQEIRSRINEDNNWGYGLFGMFSLVGEFMQKLCMMIISTVVLVPLLMLKKVIAIACVVYLGIVFMALVWLIKIRKKAYDQQMKSMGEVEKTNRLIAFYTNDISYKVGKDIRMYQAQDLIDKGGAKSYFDMKKEISKNIGNCMGKSDGLSGFIIGFSEGIAYLLVAYQAILKIISIGRVVTYAGVINQFVSALSYFVINISEIIVHANRFLSTFEYLSIPTENDFDRQSLNMEAESIHIIEFCDVSFAYPNSSKYALKDINIKISGGKQLAVVGENGSGKTTFIKLLCRLYKPTSGKILLNGIDINDIGIIDYFNMLSVVFQDFSLLAIPITDNVCIDNIVDEDKVYKVIEQVGLKERIDKEQDGIYTPIYHELYENGIEPSGGEAQKIALARAIYKDTPLLILDEPTAALDPFSEADLYSKFSEIAQDKTAIFISHRLASCKFCDEIVVFNEGRIIQYGSHAELMEYPEGKYYELWNAQAEYYR